MGLFFRKIPKNAIKVRVEGFHDRGEPLDDIMSPKLALVGSFIAKHDSENELVVTLTEGITEQEVLGSFAGLGTHASIVERKTMYEYQFGPKGLVFAFTKDN